MIVMDFRHIHRSGDPTLVLSDRSHQMVLSRVTDIVQTLHQNQLVHGDIRSINLLVDDKSLATRYTLSEKQNEVGQYVVLCI